MKIIVNADDLGYSTHRDYGIFDCYRKGKISAASLIVNGPTAAAAAAQAMSEKLCIGLHLNLTEGHPVSSNVPSLVQDSGQLYYKMSFWQLDFDIEDICRETIAQLELFRTLTGAYPQHVDGHQHVHIIPRIAEAIAPILKAYGVRSVRIPDEDVSDYSWLPTTQRERYHRRYITAVNARLIYQKQAIRAPHCFRGLGIGGALMSSERLDAALKGTFGTVEIMVHPGFSGTDSGCPTDIFNDIFDISPDRLIEMQMLQYFQKMELTDWSTAFGCQCTF